MSLATLTTGPTRRSRDIVASMADFMLARTAASGSVSREDLLTDFTAAEIDAHAEDAKARARKAGKLRS